MKGRDKRTKRSGRRPAEAVHEHAPAYDADDLLARITYRPQFFGGKPVIRGRRLAVEHVLGMLAAGDTVARILKAYPWLEREDIRACLLFARRSVAGESIHTPTKPH